MATKKKTSGTAVTETEKYAIRSMLSDNKTPQEMAKILGRSPATIKKYLESELANAVEIHNDEKDKIPTAVYDRAYSILRQQGLRDNDAHASLNKVRQKLTKILSMEDLDDLVKFALRQKSTKDVMITEADGGRKGVAVMTGAASMRMDDNRENVAPRSQRNCIFHHKDGTIE